MGKIARVDTNIKDYKGVAKKMGHGGYKSKRRPNSPMVQRKLRAEAAANFGKSAEFREAVYGIKPETE